MINLFTLFKRKKTRDRKRSDSFKAPDKCFDVRRNIKHVNRYVKLEGVHSWQQPYDSWNTQR